MNVSLNVISLNFIEIKILFTKSYIYIKIEISDLILFPMSNENGLSFYSKIIFLILDQKFIHKLYLIVLYNLIPKFDKFSPIPPKRPINL